MKQLLIFLFVLLVVQTNLRAQSESGYDNYDDEYDDEMPVNAFGHWDLGINMGMHWGAQYQAQFYDGSPTNVNNINYVFENKYWRQDIMNVLNVADTFYLRELPQKMRYTGAFQVGLYFRKTFDNYLGFSVQFDYSKLTASDFFTLEVDPQPSIGQEPDIRIYPIWGIEDRINIDFLISRYFKTNSSHLFPFFEAGFNLNSVRVKENKIRIETLEYSLVDIYLDGGYVPGLPQNEYYVQQGGIGWGISAALGLKMAFSDYVSIDPGFRFYYQSVALDHYEKLSFSYSFFVRLSLSDFFGSYEE
jgi:hypothetical protein